MKYIITEEQYKRVVNENAVVWLRRRFDLVEKSLKETYKYMEFDICRRDDYKKFEYKFFSVFMDCLHHYFYNEVNFSEDDYDTVYTVLKDLFYVECTEFYFAGREKC